MIDMDSEEFEQEDKLWLDILTAHPKGYKVMPLELDFTHYDLDVMISLN